MAKRRSAAPARQTRRNQPKREQPRQQQERRPPFLKAGDVGRRASVKFIPGSVRTFNGQWGNQLIVDVTMRGGATYSWGIGTDKPNLRLLVEHLISNPGKSLELITMQGNRGSFIAIPQEAQQPTVDDENDDDTPF